MKKQKGEGFFSWSEFYHTGKYKKAGRMCGIVHVTDYSPEYNLTFWGWLIRIVVLLLAAGFFMTWRVVND